MLFYEKKYYLKNGWLINNYYNDIFAQKRH